MSASQLDVIIEQGSTFAEVWQILNNDLTTGYTWAAKFRPQHASLTTVLSLTSAGGTLVITKSGNHTHVTASVNPATTSALTAPSRGVYDIEYTETATGIVTRAVEGSYFITPEATK